MGLDRTPPQRTARAAPPTPSHTSAVDAETSTASSGPGLTTILNAHGHAPEPGPAFLPRNPRVMRTPPSGSSGSVSAPSKRKIPEELIAPPYVEAPSVEVPIADQETFAPPPAKIPKTTSSTTATAKPRSSGAGATSKPPSSSTPGPATAAKPVSSSSKPAPAAIPPQPPAAVVTTPKPKSRKSQVAPAPLPIPEASEKPEEKEESGSHPYGRRYDMTMDALHLAIKAGTQKWTMKDLESCFPKLTAKNRSTLENIHRQCSDIMRKNILAKTEALFEYNKVGKRVQQLDGMINDAKAARERGEVGRLDAWKPDITPAALSAAANLPTYDEIFEDLKAEYNELHAECSKIFSGLLEKQAQLKSFESSVADGVSDLEKTIQTLGDFPTREMMSWAEDVTPILIPRS